MNTPVSTHLPDHALPRRGDSANFDFRSLLATGILTGVAFFSPPLFLVVRYSLTAFNKPVVLGLILALAILYLHRLTISKSAAQLGFLQLAQAAALLVLPFMHMSFGYGLDSGYFSIAIQILAGLALFEILANANRVGLLASFWVNLHLVMGASGLCAFVGGVVLNLQPIDTFLDRPYYDFGLTYTNVFYEVGNLKLIRVAGFYDEPGTFAFYVTFALLLARIFDMPRWKELLLIIFGLTSLSMAFIVVSLIWIAVAVSRAHLKYLILISAGLTLVLANVDSTVRDYVYDVTVDRFSISRSEGRVLKGDNRTPIMKENFKAFVESPIIGHGLHYEDYVGDRYKWSFIVNPMAPFATHGVVGALFVNFHVIALCVLLAKTRRLSRRNKSYIFLVLLSTLAQRPITINGLGYVLFIVMIYQLLPDTDSRPGTSAHR